MVTRMIFITVTPEKVAEAERIWKNECGPLLMKQRGCMTHLFMRSRENPHKFVSLSHWATPQAIDEYAASAAREEISSYTRGVLGAIQTQVEVFDVIG